MYRLSQAARIVIKIGSRQLIDHDKAEVRLHWLASVAQDIAWLTKQNCKCIVVSSGSVGLGRQIIGLPLTQLKLDQSQAAAAIGQIALAKAWTEALGEVGLAAGQILLTLEETEARRRYLSAKTTIENLLSFSAIPIINENDSVSANGLRFGDNDRLAARVAVMTEADILVIVSDVDGLYDRNPGEPGAVHLDFVDAITPQIEIAAGSSGNIFTQGGMKTKIDAAKTVTAAGCAMAICSGTEIHPLRRLDEAWDKSNTQTDRETSRATWFKADGNPQRAKRRWLASSLHVTGSIVIDKGAAHAIRRGNSLLPSGVTGVSGDFTAGDIVLIVDATNREIGRGLVAYDASEAEKICGLNSNQIKNMLGYPGKSNIIHRDNMYLVNGDVSDE